MSAPPAEENAALALERLRELIRRLRAPDGCPWDREQTPASACAYLLEEAYEAVEAVESAAPGQARAELGDLLFQAVFMVNLYEERGLFSLAQVLAEVEAKMRRRHPHVFGPDQAASPEEVRQLWGRIKQREREEAGQAPQGLLDSVPLAAPALVRAYRLGQRAARVNFDWQTAPQVWDKVGEELAELAQAQTLEERQDELGDLLFALAQWARHQNLNPETALRAASQRFQARFAFMEGLARRRGLELGRLDPAQWDQLWEEAKAGLASAPGGA